MQTILVMMVISLSEALTTACLAYWFPSQPSPIFNNYFRSSSLPLHLWPTHHLLSFSVDDCLLHRTNRSDRLGILSTSGQQTYNPHCSLHRYSFSYSSRKGNPHVSRSHSFQYPDTFVFSALSVFLISFQLKKKKAFPSLSHLNILWLISLSNYHTLSLLLFSNFWKSLSSLPKLRMVTLPGPCDCAQLLSCVQLFATPWV